MLTIGKLAKQSGVTVRTLHHYDALGLVSPSERTQKGYRLYGAEDIARLQMVRALQESGFSLKAVKEMLDQPNFSLRTAIRQQSEILAHKIKLEEELHNRLVRMAELLADRKSVPLEDVLRILTIMNNVKKMNLDPEDEKRLESHWASISPEEIKAVEAEWPQLIAKVRAAMKAGKDPKSAEVQALAKRWKELVEKFTGGIHAVNEHTAREWREHGDEIRAQHGENVPDKEMFAYIGKALK